MTLAEGVRLVEEALSAGVTIQGALVTAGLAQHPRGAALIAALAARAVATEELDQRAFSQLADTDTPQGVIAVIEPPRWTLADLRPGRGAPLLVLDAVQDPGNVGTLLRTAFALGAAGAVLLKGTADLTNPKVVRGAMGATFRLPAVAADVAEFANWAQRERLVIWTAAADGAPLGRATPPERLALVVGNEGAGVSAEVRALAQQHVAIPLARGAESLNVAVAAGILLYEAARAR
ncbi:MAG TPA: RNA methyltransferase [Gemmatimonadales bacterium]|nr:RNA methyltransferase [Gemmatimonadales bacterium]